MTTFAARLSDYVEHRRRLGADMKSVGAALRPFAAFADAEGAEVLTTDLCMRWKATFGSAGPNAWGVRLGAVRGFAIWLQGIDACHEVPPRDLFPRCRTRPRPWIYSDAEIGRILTAAAALPSRSGLRGATCSTLFGLIAVTGLRIGEALGLDDGDIDAGNAVLAVRHGKNGRSRVIPVTGCVIAKLRDYRRFRDRVAVDVGSDALFRTGNGTRTGAQAARRDFARVGQAIGLREPSRKCGRGPRIHDLRHTMATRTILDCFRQGRDVDVEMYRLSSYLGHAKPADTFWYIEAVPELLALVSERGPRALGERGAS